MKHGAKNRSNTRKILNNNNVHIHARTLPPTHLPTHTLFTHYIYCDMSLSGLSLLYRKCGLYRL